MQEVLYLFHHVFLPPKIPQEEEYCADHEMLLIEVVLDALRSFGVFLPAKDADTFSLVTEAFLQVRQIHSRDGGVDEVELKKALGRLVKGGFLSIHVRQQNAGILISQKGDTTHVESFELSPTNTAVMSTQGRLQRTFPGPALALDTRVFNEANLLNMLAQTIARMSQQPVAGTKPKVQKAKQNHDEDRDTTDPKMVTEFLMATLRPLSTDVTDMQIQKHTREEVMWHNSRYPWRRSALWLLLRVTLQLSFCRSSNGQRAHELYKSFMIFLMSSVIEKASSIAPGEVLYLMAAKAIRRLWKLEFADEPAWFASVQLILNQVSDKTQSGWQRIMDQKSCQIDLDILTHLDFIKDTEGDLPRLDQYLADIGQRIGQSSLTSFQRSSQVISFEPEKLPMGLNSCNSEFLVQNLCVFEDWVESYLDTWMKDHLEDAGTCGKLGRLISEYRELASKEYQHNPEATSVMMLTLLELWIACDKSAIHAHRHLEDYDPYIPVTLFNSLLLPFNSQMKRLYIAELYLNQRQSHSKYRGSGIFHDFGTETCFSVRHFDQSDEHQQLFQRIEEQATRARSQKITELAEKKAISLTFDIFKICTISI
ncbi:hypothetical protein N7462_008835 [Penicillium macrosclerotiorum]|uniref:uncharacterized protein n=1 Tax=Penicillium macrosclerotiorum TaxID=303699 RepID=UPI002548C95B|nr:uncharacterized protein N7462_008835 [Penicillium macrosclerotiorum]KAJ5675938.1 hypothetical protein N7462_008835 [Penicillium macrosclerotiorum]